jgi:hypothetical protein
LIQASDDWHLRHVKTGETHSKTPRFGIDEGELGTGQRDRAMRVRGVTMKPVPPLHYFPRIVAARLLAVSGQLQIIRQPASLAARSHGVKW